jgi:hypothetical protein
MKPNVSDLCIKKNIQTINTNPEKSLKVLHNRQEEMGFQAQVTVPVAAAAAAAAVTEAAASKKISAV